MLKRLMELYEFREYRRKYMTHKTDSGNNNTHEPLTADATGLNAWKADIWKALALAVENQDTNSVIGLSWDLKKLKTYGL